VRSPPRRPIVLAHGLAGFSRFAVRRLKVATYFRGIPDHLESQGCSVIVTDVPPLGSVAERAACLRAAIRAAAGSGKVHLIAHSMGGLDARHMITRLGMDEQVLTLVTLGTPHRGSPVADRIFAIAKKLRVLDALARHGLQPAALRDLRTEVCAEWGEKTPDSPDVRYFSIAGVKRRREMLYSLRFTHDVVQAAEGENDGLVSRASAAWGRVLPAWDCDHLNLVNWIGPHTKALGYARDVRPRYTRLARLCADVERR
jgi:triacylglycerol lipase